MGLLDRLRREPEPPESAVIIDKVRKALPSIGGALTPATGPGSAVDLSSIGARMAIGGMAGMTGVPPEEIVAALEAEGMSYSAPFAPGRPLQPYAGYEGDPRLFNYVVGQNISTRPRTGRVPFDLLQGIIDAYDVAQVCIRHITNDVRTLPLMFSPLDGVTDDVTAEIQAAKDFWRRPDKHLPFKAWLAKFLSDTLRYDAGALYKQRTRNGSLHALKVVDGTTIAPLIDYYGDIPDPPAPAYSQFVNGLPWKWLTTEDLVYVPMNPLANSVYGLAPIEAVLMTANTDVRFQWHFLNYFTEGTIPEGFMEAPPDVSAPEQIEKWQALWDAVMLGDQTRKHQIRWVPNGARYTAAKDQSFDEMFPLYLMRRVCAAYGVTPNDLGFTENVNRATGDTQIDVQWRVGTKPVVGHLEDIINDVTQNDLGLRVQVMFDAGQEKEDRLTEAQAHQLYVMMGAESADEVREQVLGLPVDPSAPTPRFVTTSTGLVPIQTLVHQAGVLNPETAAPEAGTVGHAEKKPGVIESPIDGEDEGEGEGEVATKRIAGILTDLASTITGIHARIDAVEAARKAAADDTFTPPAGVRAEAKRALEWIKDGHAGSNFTDVGRARAAQLANGNPVSLDTIKRMASYLARHEVDKKGEGFSPGEKGYPSAGRVAWAAWGGDPAISWTNSILSRAEKNTAGITSGTDIDGVDIVRSDDEDEPDAAELRRWKANARSRAKKGLPVRRFPDLTGPTVDAIWRHLEHATTYDEIDAAFSAAEREAVPFG